MSLEQVDRLDGDTLKFQSLWSRSTRYRWNPTKEVARPRLLHSL